MLDKNERHWKQYVQHCVNEVRHISEQQSWRYCPGTNNHADHPSRSMDAGDLVNDQLWWRVPTFLQDDSSSWPDLQTTFETNDANKELVKNSPAIVHSLASQTKHDASGVVNLEKFMNVENFGSRIKLLCVTSIVLKFIALLKKGPSANKSVITRGHQFSRSSVD